MSKPSNTSLEETISKEQFFIELYNSEVDIKIMESFESNIEFFRRLGIEVLYKKKLSDKVWRYYLEPQEKKYGTIGYRINKNQGEQK